MGVQEKGNGPLLRDSRSARWHYEEGCAHLGSQKALVPPRVSNPAVTDLQPLGASSPHLKTSIHTSPECGEETCHG